MELYHLEIHVADESFPSLNRLIPYVNKCTCYSRRKKSQRRLIHLHMETLWCRIEPCQSSERWSDQAWTGIGLDCSRECVLFVRRCVRRSPGVGAVQHLLGLAPYHLLFQVVEHSDPEQHPAQRKPSGHNKALTRHKRWASRTNTHMHTSRHTHNAHTDRTACWTQFKWVKWDVNFMVTHTIDAAGTAHSLYNTCLNYRIFVCMLTYKPLAVRAWKILRDRTSIHTKPHLNEYLNAENCSHHAFFFNSSQRSRREQLRGSEDWMNSRRPLFHPLCGRALAIDEGWQAEADKVERGWLTGETLALWCMITHRSQQALSDSEEGGKCGVPGSGVWYALRFA